MADGPSDRSGYLTMRQAAEWLGLGSSRSAGRRLRARLERRQEELARPVLIPGTGRTGYQVTKATLRDVLPEHFSRRDRIEGMVRDRLRALDATISQVAKESKKRDRALGAHIRRLTRETRSLAKTIGIDLNGP